MEKENLIKMKVVCPKGLKEPFLRLIVCDSCDLVKERKKLLPMNTPGSSYRRKHYCSWDGWGGLDYVNIGTREDPIWIYKDFWPVSSLK